MSLNDRTSHASRNPGKAVQEARGRKKRDPDQPAPTPAEKATKAKAAKQKKEGIDAMWADIDAFYAQRAETIVALALKHDKTPDYIKALLNNSSQFKAERKVSLRNAVTSHIARTETADDGFKLADTELQARVNEVLAEGISDEDAQQWMQDVEDKRLLNRVGMRANNTAAHSDTVATVTKIETAVHQLHARTGTRIILFASRGHVDDANRPVVVYSGGSDKFCIEVCKKPALQMLQEFELWSCTRSNQNLTRDTRASMSAQASKFAEDRLRAFVNDDTVTVSYKNFKVDMQGLWGVEISGWPADIPFVCPAQLKTNERLRRIRDGWLNGTISWVKLTPLQAAAVAAELAAVRAANDGDAKQRKQRKDAGGKHEKASKASKASKKDKRGSKSQPSRRQRDAPSEGEEDEEEEQEEEAEREEDSVNKSVPTPITALSQAPASTFTSSGASTGPIPIPIPVPIPMPAASAEQIAASADVHLGTEGLTDVRLLPRAPATLSTADEEFDADYLLSLLPDFDSTTFPIFDMESLGAGVGQNQTASLSTFAPVLRVHFDSPHFALPPLDAHFPALPGYDSHLSTPAHFPPPSLDTHGAPAFDAHSAPGFDAQGAPAFGVHGAPAFDVHLSSMPAIDGQHIPSQLRLCTPPPLHFEARPVTVHQLADAHPMQASPSAFISYWPVLADGSNNAARKRKAPEDTDTAKPAKKKRVTGSDASERPKAKPRNKAAAGTSTSRTPRMGPPRATAERDMAVLAAQLPPRA
ncbi:hypothetical protein C8R43DRAFT_1045614 [Mycena crocata]|nr:hypothetical protein C8R43DRAFT_1045614 [Mycena crocata]